MFLLSILYTVLVFFHLAEICVTFSIAPCTRGSSSSSSSNIALRHRQWTRPVTLIETHSMFTLYGSDDNEINTNEEDVQQLRKEEEDLQNELHYIQALVQRNKAQLGSFVDEKHQWESQSDEDRYFLSRKPFVKKRLAEVRLKLTLFVPKEF